MPSKPKRYAEGTAVPVDRSLAELMDEGHLDRMLALPSGAAKAS